MLTGFLLPGAARRAMVAGAIGLIAGAHAAGAAVVGSDSGFTLVGDAGTTILFDPYPFPTSFEASVKSAYQAGVTIMAGASTSKRWMERAASPFTMGPTPRLARRR